MTRHLSAALIVLLLAASVAGAQQRRLGRSFYLVGGALGTAMVFDTKSTYDVFAICEQCTEGNPFAAPFISQGPTVGYAAGALFDVAVLTLAGKMKTSDHAWMRRVWWVVPVAITSTHVAMYRRNRYGPLPPSWIQ